MQVERFKTPVLAKLEASASSPGTCGELVQGQFADGIDFLVTFPIDLWAEVHVELHLESSRIQSAIVGKEKTKQAIRKALDYLGCPSHGAFFSVNSEIPEGKGMASSTADIVAACRATAKTLGTSLTPEEIARIAIEIEPSDGIMYSDVVAFDHRCGKLIERLGKLPPMNLLVLDFGGYIDTLKFNQKEKNYSQEERIEIEKAYELLRTGLQEKDLRKVGRAATMSAKINQRILPKPHLNTLIEIAEKSEAYGVCIAHSGTIAALIFDQDAKQALEEAKDLLWQEIGPNTFEIIHPVQVCL